MLANIEHQEKTPTLRSNIDQREKAPALLSRMTGQDDRGEANIGCAHLWVRTGSATGGEACEGTH